MPETLSRPDSSGCDEPSLVVLSRGGTISSTRGSAEEGVSPKLTAEELVGDLDAPSLGASIETVTVSTLPSVDLTAVGVLELRETIQRFVDRGLTGS